LGHSIGGYLAVSYAEQHPAQVVRLILASPAGVPTPPADLSQHQAKSSRLIKLLRALWRRGVSPFVYTKDLGKGRALLTSCKLPK
ncbi:MAG: hypothetical protein SGPRY_011274, partial [Prymnesium sp.]